MRIPEDFVLGAATAAYQIEGAVAEDGRGESIWDRFSHTPGKTVRGETGDIACDHYHRWQEDVRLMRELGIQSYRFSIAWPRVLPNGHGTVNEKGLDFYRRLVEALLAAGIQPMATLYHWDLPQALQDKGGWPNRDTAKAFAEYAHVVFRTFGDQIPLYVTLNEPWCASVLGHLIGVHAPGMNDIRATLAAAHHLLLGHGLAVQAFRDESLERARIGITNILTDIVPASEDPADTEAASRADAYFNRWFLDPVVRGTYPDALAPFGLAAIVQPADLDTIRQPLDFLGVNYYQQQKVQAQPNDPLLGFRALPPEGELTAMSWGIQPEGLYRVLRRVHDEYGPIPLYVTENGAAFEDVLSEDGQHVEDPRRIAYLQAHLAAVLKARAEGVDVRGYYVWSLLDNFEWAEGYAKRFGLVYVDYPTQRRIVKASGHWYRAVLERRALDV
ncbi:MAG: beta-glucosidase [Thermoflavifilum sp.]|nr:beta-glucosidase [Thermoflavifilum sp.]MCL6514827.1 beta-glucosidase [Alicyclobacillus sp.]